MIVDGNNNNFEVAGGCFGFIVGGTPFLTESFGQVELLRHIKKKKPLLKGDTFESLQKNMNKESFDYVTKNKKFFMNPIVSKLGLAAFFIGAGMFLGSLVQKTSNKN